MGTRRDDVRLDVMIMKTPFCAPNGPVTLERECTDKSDSKFGTAPLFRAAYAVNDFSLVPSSLS